MSLVSEALKKAQREAAAREGRERQLPDSLLGAAGQPYRAGNLRGLRIKVFAGLAIAVVVLVAVLDWWLRDQRAAEAEPDPPAAVAPESASSAETTPPPVATAPATVLQPEAEPEPAAPSAAIPTPPPAAAPPARQEPVPGSSAPARPAPGTPLADGSFVRRAVLPGGATLELGGIAWSPDTPVALINGRLLGLREGIEGCILLVIERELVRLRRPDGATLVLRLREPRRRSEPERDGS